jgi:ABC-2 type transport system permease protein
MSATATGAPLVVPRAGRARRPATRTVYRWELRKLVSQKRTYLGLGLGVIMPLIFVASQQVHQHHDRGENIFASQISQSGLATPVLMLLFESFFLLPLIAALVAGDIVAAEDGNGTLKTILTRSRERGEVFAGKALATATYTLAVVFAMGLTGLVAGSIAWGFHPLTSLSGTKVSSNHGFGLMLSTITRNSAASVVGALMWALLMQLLGVLPGTEAIRPYLLGTQFEAWHGFLRVPADWVPVVRALWVCALYIALPVIAAYLVFLRRDVAGD